MTRNERFEALFTAHYRDIHRFALRRTEPAAAKGILTEEEFQAQKARILAQG